MNKVVNLETTIMAFECFENENNCLVRFVLARMILSSFETTAMLQFTNTQSIITNVIFGVMFQGLF